MVRQPAGSVITPRRRTSTRRFRFFSYGYVALFILLGAAYTVLTLTHQATKAALRQYHLTTASYHWLIVSVLIILGITWAASLYGSLVFKSYSYLIKKSNDGSALNTLSNGLIVLSIAQPVGSNVSSLFGIIDSHHPNLIPTLTIITNYLNLVLAAVALFLIAMGAERLYQLIGDGAKILQQRIWVITFIIISALYSYFIVIQPIHTPLARRAYFLPDWLLVCSITIPYAIFWYFGLNAAFQINRYQKNSRGWLYKSALNYLAAGVAIVIISSVATRILITISSRLSQLSLTPLLFVIYGLLLIDAAGFILIAVGARRLRRIEEV